MAKGLSLRRGRGQCHTVSVNGSLVIDATGQWVGPTMSMDWSNLNNVPADIADGDGDVLFDIVCHR